MYSFDPATGVADPFMIQSLDDIDSDPMFQVSNFRDEMIVTMSEDDDEYQNQWVSTLPLFQQGIITPVKQLIITERDYEILKD